MEPAPIVFFVYNRLEHTRRAIEALQQARLASESSLLIYSDGPRNSEAEPGVRLVRDFLKTVTGFKQVSLVEREGNYGLARNTIEALTEVSERHGRFIMMEDDNICSPHFLEYMNDGLKLYENDDRVISIHGYVYPVAKPLPETFFIRGADSWGWATWKRGWDLYERDGAKLLRELEEKNLTREFNFGGCYNFTKMLKQQIRGKVDSWSIRWYASAFLKNKLTLYPGRSLIQNIGFDTSGTHTSVKTGALDVELLDRAVKLEKIPVEENREARAAIGSFLRTLKLRLLWSFLTGR